MGRAAEEEEEAELSVGKLAPEHGVMGNGRFVVCSSVAPPILPPHFDLHNRLTDGESRSVSGRRSGEEKEREGNRQGFLTLLCFLLFFIKKEKPFRRGKKRRKICTKTEYPFLCREGFFSGGEIPSCIQLIT